MNKNQKGFAALEGLLVLIIVALIAGTGYYILHSKSQTDKNLNNALTSSQDTSASKAGSSQTVSSQSDAQQIAAVLAEKCHDASSSVDVAKLGSFLAKTYTGPNSPLVIGGNGDYAKTNTICDTTAAAGGFMSLLRKSDGTWKIVFQGQNWPDCDAVDGQGWPLAILDTCYDTSTQSQRSPK